jgi:hypothetical protein
MDQGILRFGVQIVSKWWYGFTPVPVPELPFIASASARRCYNIRAFWELLGHGE